MKGGGNYPSGECEFEIVGAEGVVVDGDVDDVVQKLRFAEKILGHAEPEPEELLLRCQCERYDIMLLVEGEGGGLTGVEHII